MKKCPGRVEKLEKILFQNPSEGNLGIGHVRWAAHGVHPTKQMLIHTRLK